MSVASADLAKLYPLDSLRSEHLEHLAREAESFEAGKGEVLFSAGDFDEHTLYLVSGQVLGSYPDGKTKGVSSDSLQSRYPLGDLQPRRFTAKVESMSATLIKLDRRYTEKMIAWDQLTRTQGFRHYDTEPDSNRWVFRLLQSRALQKMPTANIERMFTRFEEVNVKSGQVIVREGDEADYFYVIKDGAASVSKHLDGTESVVAYLVRGDSFGEDALLSNSTRNATVTMIKDGRLMRLSNRDFGEVLKPPVVDWLSPGQASIQVRKGAVVVDVRLEAEHGERAIKGSINAPLYRLREAAADWERDRPYIVYCNTGERSAAAAFILAKLGFEVYAIQGGLSGMLRQLDKQAAPK
jgi:CRP-like cAMP-binding protein/rhodanese-related sulfurtransferase